MDAIRDQLDEEQERRSDMQRALSKANAEVQAWKTKFITEGSNRTEELEEGKYVTHRSYAQLGCGCFFGVFFGGGGGGGGLLCFGFF